MLKNNILIIEIQHKMVKGKLLDDQTRCEHYHSALDVIAIKFKCCNEYYPCYECHQELANHPAKVWSKIEFEEKAILCGGCKNELTINEYLTSENVCQYCQAKFNPNCKKHYALYFDPLK
jgi:uncharacterized CHY-type Zn-finger protein